MPLPEVVETLSQLTPKTFNAVQNPPVEIAALQKALSSSDSRNAQLNHALTALKKTNAGTHNALAAARVQNDILQDSLSTADTFRANLHTELQTSRKHKQQLCNLLAESDKAVTEHQSKLDKLRGTDISLMYNERQDALLLCDEMRGKYLDSLSRLSLLQRLNATASATSARLRKEKNAAEEKLEVATAEKDCIQHKIQTATQQLAKIQLQHPIVEVNHHCLLCWCHKCAGLEALTAFFKFCCQTTGAGYSILF